MTKFRILGAACVAAMLVASPALARGGHMGAAQGGMAHFAAGGGNWHGGGGWRGGGFRRGGFGSGIAAGVIAGAALGGAYYAADPGYYSDTYAYDPGYAYDNGYNTNGYNNGYGGYNNGYNPNPNGFVCQPGTVFKGEDGRPHLCQ